MISEVTKTLAPTFWKHVLAAYDVLTLTSTEMDQFEDQEWLQEDGGVNSIKLQTIRRGTHHADEEH
jgi:hypothetical protein